MISIDLYAIFDIMSSSSLKFFFVFLWKIQSKVASLQWNQKQMNDGQGNHKQKGG